MWEPRSVGKLTVIVVIYNWYFYIECTTEEQSISLLCMMFNDVIWGGTCTSLVYEAQPQTKF